MRMVILGPPGAGKGTQASRIAATHKIPAISTGDIFRNNIKERTDLGRQVEEVLSSGGYVSDELTVEIVKDRLAQPDAETGFLLDGFPRTTVQVHALDDLLGRQGRRLDVVLELVVDDDAVVDRLIKRAATDGRTDDTEDVIRERQRIYHEETAPLADLYREHGLLVDVDGMGEVDDVANRVEAALAAVRS